MSKEALLGTVVISGTSTVALSGTAAVTQSGTWTIQPGNTANTTPWLISERPATSGGCSLYRKVDLDETGRVVKASAGQVYGWALYNTNVAGRFVKLYNKATAADENDTPLLTIYVPPTAQVTVVIPCGTPFALGISARATTGVADADTGGPDANDIIAHIFYS